MSTSALIGRSPMAISRCCSHFGDGPFFTPRTSRSAKPGQSSGAVDRHLDRAVALARRPARSAAVFSVPRPARREVARDAVDAGRVGPVRRQVDLDDRIVELGIGGEARADRRVGRQVDDAVMLVGQLAARAPSTSCRGSRRRGSCRRRASRRCRAHRRRARRRRRPGPARAFGAPQTTCTGLPSPVSTVSTCSLSASGCCSAVSTLAMTKGFSAGLVVDMLDLEADRGQPLDDLVERGVGLEMVLEPGEGEFHDVVPSGLGTLVSTWRGRPSGMCTKGSCSRT